jgi:hypothetical protein
MKPRSLPDLTTKKAFMGVQTYVVKPASKKDGLQVTNVVLATNQVS